MGRNRKEISEQGPDRTARIAVLLTATIDPKGMAFVRRSDPRVREADYMNALGKWARVPCPLIFCENSNYDLRNIERGATRSVEFLQFDGQDFPRHLGKGVGEMLILRHAVETSRVLRECDHVIKVSGRYFVKNVHTIIQALLRFPDTYVMADLQKELRWSDSYVFAFQPSFVPDYLWAYKDRLDDSKGFCFEHALARAAARAVSDGHRWRPLPARPIVTGISGTSGKPHHTGTIRAAVLELLHAIKNRLNRKRFE